MGVINYNSANLKDKSDAKIQDYIMTSIHELLHVLGVSASAFPKYIDTEGNIRKGHIVEFKSASGAVGNGLSTPKLLEYARTFYDCDSWDSIPLENDGGQGSLGSHLERAFFLNEVMTGSAIKDKVVSGFTWKMLEDSGWYGAVDEYLYEPFSVGKGSGCAWR